MQQLLVSYYMSSMVLSLVGDQISLLWVGVTGEWQSGVLYSLIFGATTKD